MNANNFDLRLSPRTLLGQVRFTPPVPQTPGMMTPVNSSANLRQEFQVRAGRAINCRRGSNSVPCNDDAVLSLDLSFLRRKRSYYIFIYTLSLRCFYIAIFVAGPVCFWTVWGVQTFTLILLMSVGLT